MARLSVIFTTLFCLVSLWGVSHSAVNKPDSDELDGGYDDATATRNPDTAQFVGVDNVLNTTCILMSFNSTISIEYTTSGKKNNTIHVPLNADVQDLMVAADCRGPLQKLEIEWLPPKATMDWLMFLFFNHTSDNRVVLQKVELHFTMEKTLFPDATAAFNVSIAKTMEFSSASVNDTYRCNANQNFDLGDQFHWQVDHLRAEAFLPASTDVFSGSETLCEQDKPDVSNLVPIIVGVCLAALIVVVLVAYLVGRRRRDYTELS